MLSSEFIIAIHGAVAKISFERNFAHKSPSVNQLLYVFGTLLRVVILF